MSDSRTNAARAQDKKSAPLKLALLVGCGILLPLGVAAWFLFRTQKYHGPNNVAQETLDIFCRHACAPCCACPLLTRDRVPSLHTS